MRFKSVSLICSECGHIQSNTSSLRNSGSPCDLEDPQESYAAEDRDTERRHDGELHQDGLHDATAHHETVEAIKQ